jgi:hypothetical protein
MHPAQSPHFHLLPRQRAAAVINAKGNMANAAQNNFLSLMMLCDALFAQEKLAAKIKSIFNAQSS